MEITKRLVDISFRGVRMVMLVLIFWATYTNMCEVEGGISEEDLELERQLKILNKPAVKVIKTEYGDVYNCVDIYKQPAFDHPLLKDHKIQVPKDYWSKVKTSAIKPSKFGLKKGCPLGSVPIRRVTKEDLIRAKSVLKKYAGFYGRKDQGNGFEFAGIQTVKPAGPVYQGAEGTIAVYNPAVQPQEFSSAMISIESGDQNEQNYIQFGWTVNPPLYGDSRTRLFTSWTKDNRQATGCYNMLCGGFVHLNHNIPLDFVFENISVVAKEQFDVKLAVYRRDNFHWYLSIGEHDRVIGYWPVEIFSHLATLADYIQWGGQVYSPDPQQHTPQMGSGIWHNGWYQDTCYFRRVKLANSSYSPVAPDNNYIQGAESRCYLVGDYSYKDDFWQYSFDFGGSGGIPTQCIAYPLVA